MEASTSKRATSNTLNLQAPINEAPPIPPLVNVSTSAANLPSTKQQINTKSLVSPNANNKKAVRTPTKTKKPQVGNVKTATSLPQVKQVRSSAIRKPTTSSSNTGIGGSISSAKSKPQLRKQKSLEETFVNKSAYPPIAATIDDNNNGTDPMIIEEQEQQEFHQTDPFEINDPNVVQRIPVYFTNQLGLPGVQLLQFPIREKSRPYAEGEQPIKTRLKPNSKHLELDIPLDTNNAYYDKHRGQELALGTNDEMAKTIRDRFSQVNDDDKLDRQTLQSTAVPPRLRPGLKYLDKIDEKQKAANKKIDEEESKELNPDVDNEEPAASQKGKGRGRGRAVQISAKTNDPDAAAKRKSTYSLSQREAEDEKWIELDYYYWKTPEAARLFDKIEADKRHCANLVPKTGRKSYLEAIQPPKPDLAKLGPRILDDDEDEEMESCDFNARAIITRDQLNNSLFEDILKMAETVQYYLEQMVPELEDLEQKKLFTKAEIKLIIKRRTNFEYSLERIQPQKMDFLRYIEYEMNLEQLRKKRKKRMNIKGKTTISDYAIPRRIYQIYDRALIKFKGDVALWLQYIEYAKTSGAGKLLGKIYGRAIQLHPTKPELWILAAKWEFESNANIVAARVLMQRGLRFNNASKQLWQEYFKLELLYVEKITTRRKILGILSKEPKKNSEEELEIEERPDIENMIRLPKLTGEDLYLYENKKPLTSEIDEKHIEKLKEDNNKMLQGAIARTVFENAIKVAIPDDLFFRQKFLDICREFTNTKELQELIYNSIEQDFFNDAKARAFLAERHVTFILNIECPEFINALKKSINEFEQSIEKLMNTEIWYLYTKFLTKYFNRVTEPNLRRYFSKLLTKAYETTDTKNLTSNEMYFDWAEFVSSHLNSHELALETLEKGTHKYPNYAKLWIKRITITLESKDDTKNNPSSLFDEALKLNPVSQELWQMYLDWLFKRFNNGELVESKLDDLLMASFFACLLASLCGSSSINNSQTELSSVQYVVAFRYLSWVKNQGGIKKARKIYESLISKTLPTRSFFEICINLERESLGSSTQPNDIERISRLYDQALNVTESQQDDDDTEKLWLAYIEFLLVNKQFGKANNIYWRARKSVPNPESFEVEYRGLLNLQDNVM
ncbi:159_t:CDS:10 [Ambispora leptoticha]|uniref:159_t:CDS:1 n=1 Tax=Ambispora leptoticha TaxID=144679 RepID=A0A9N8ZWP7_9GLOM|nr:159_t:CDS:10 [Ambispora leptoticha]